MIEIANKVYYVGVNDRNKSLFEGLWPLPYGVSYNSYLIDDEKVCLIDTVEVDFFVQFIERLREVLGDRQIDYLVINHMEPDHSGSLALLRKYYPNIQVIGNKKTFDMMSGFYGIKDNTIEVKNGEELNLGNHTLQFYMTPMVHWPETMMTHCKGEVSYLFTGDAFGCFGALNGGLIDKDIDTDWCWLEMVRYYSNIVGKYGTPVQNALKKLAGIHFDYICSTHGPVWHQYVDKVVALYDRMSKYETEPGLVICYGTMYGNTEQMADIIAQSLAAAGVKNIVCHNVSKSEQSQILCDIFRYKGLIIGSPTYSNGIFSPIENIMNLIRVRELKNRTYAVFGSYTWAPMAVKKLLPFAEEMKWELVGTPFELKMADLPSVIDAAWQLGQDFAEALNK